MMYGNYGNGFSYSPDRSRDVDRFNCSTRPNYRPSTANPYNQPNQYQYTKSRGHYDGRGKWVED